MQPEMFVTHWREIAAQFLKLGFTAYGGPAIMGIMQAEIQEGRRWVSKERFVEGLSLANVLPGATATQLGIFLGHARGGWWGGVLAGLCFVLPAFAIMLGLAVAYAHLGATPVLRGGLYGLGPVVLGIFVVAVYRLGRSAMTTRSELIIAVGAAAAAAFSPLGMATILVLAAGVGLWRFHSARVGSVTLAVLIAIIGVAHVALRLLSPLAASPVHPTAPASANLVDLAVFFFKVGALTFGGGLTMIALIQEQVVDRYHWLTHREFIDGLALGQFTPGPILMVAAYVGYKIAGFAGAMTAAVTSFLPSFILMLSILPVFERVRALRWTKAVMRGVGPAVIGVLAVFLVKMVPHALPDTFAIAISIATVAALLAWRVGTVKLMVGGAVLGVLRSRVMSATVVRAALGHIRANAGV